MHPGRVGPAMWAVPRRAVLRLTVALAACLTALLLVRLVWLLPLSGAPSVEGLVSPGEGSSLHGEGGTDEDSVQATAPTSYILVVDSGSSGTRM